MYIAEIRITLYKANSEYEKATDILSKLGMMKINLNEDNHLTFEKTINNDIFDNLTDNIENFDKSLKRCGLECVYDLSEIMVNAIAASFPFKDHIVMDKSIYVSDQSPTHSKTTCMSVRIYETREDYLVNTKNIEAIIDYFRPVTYSRLVKYFYSFYKEYREFLYKNIIKNLCNQIQDTKFSFSSLSNKVNDCFNPNSIHMTWYASKTWNECDVYFLVIEGKNPYGKFERLYNISFTDKSFSVEYCDLKDGEAISDHILNFKLCGIGPSGESRIIAKY